MKPRSLKTHTQSTRPMPFSIDLVFTLQLLIALFVVATLQAEPAKAEAITPERSGHEPFLLSDGHTYVEHAGMTIEQELYRTLCADDQPHSQP